MVHQVMRLRLLLGLAPGPALLLGGQQAKPAATKSTPRGSAGLTGHCTVAYAAPWLPDPAAASRKTRRRRQEAELLALA